MITKRIPGRQHGFRSSAAAFTLIELMVALGIGGLAITTIYAIGITATREFYRQDSVSDTQMSLRHAMNMVKRDIARAGFLATPNATPSAGAPQTCGAEPGSWTSGANGPLAAFTLFQNDVPVSVANGNMAIAPAGTENDPTQFNVDSVVLTGNYETTSEYAGIRMIGNSQVMVNQNWHNFQRDFTDWFAPAGATPVYAPALFEKAFAVGRLIRIQTTRRRRHFARIQFVDPMVDDEVKITFDPPLPALCDSEAKDGWVAPVSMIQLSVLDRPAGARFAQGIGAVGQLMRREVDPTDRSRLLSIPLTPGVNTTNSRSLLDFVVAFQLSFTMSTAGVGLPDNYAIGVTTVDNNVANMPERIRAVSIVLAARTPQEDPSLQWTRAGCALNWRCFQVFPKPAGAGNSMGAARVRWLRSEVFVPNVAYEGY